jgi:hypothetical protein
MVSVPRRERLKLIGLCTDFALAEGLERPETDKYTSPETQSMRRFPIISLGLLAASLIALFAIGQWANSLCAFGFGGFQCNDPLSGWGGTILVAILALIVAVVILAVTASYQVFRWWRGWPAPRR